MVLPLGAAACASDSSDSTATPDGGSVGAASSTAPTEDPVPDTPFVDAFVAFECGPVPNDVDGIVTLLRTRLADVDAAAITTPEAGAATVQVRVPRTATIDPATICATPVFEVRPVLATGSGSFVDVDGSSLDLGPAVSTEAPLTPNVSIEQLETGEWAAIASLTDAGTTAINDVAARCFAADDTCPTARLALVLDGRVIVSPTVMTPTFDGSMQIFGAYSEDAIREIAAGLEAAAIGFGLVAAG